MHSPLKEITHSRILPIDIDSIQAVLIHEADDIVLEDLAIGWQDGLTQDGEGSGLRAERPATKRDDSLDIIQPLEIFKLLLGSFVSDLRLIGPSSDVCKGEVNVRVIGGNARHKHI